jgi:hypothetical protein
VATPTVSMPFFSYDCSNKIKSCHDKEEEYGGHVVALSNSYTLVDFDLFFSQRERDDEVLVQSKG